MGNCQCGESGPDSRDTTAHGAPTQTLRRHGTNYTGCTGWAVGVGGNTYGAMCGFALETAARKDDLPAFGKPTNPISASIFSSNSRCFSSPCCPACRSDTAAVALRVLRTHGTGIKTRNSQRTGSRSPSNGRGSPRTPVKSGSQALACHQRPPRASCRVR